MDPKNKEKNDFLDELKKGTDKVIKASMQFSKIASEKIDESTKSSIEKAKSNPTLNRIKLKTEQATKTGLKKSKEIQEKSPGFFNKVCQKSLCGFEKFVGTIRRGTQYGKTSIEMLEQFSKMKELGIITDEEFEIKKKEILDRI
jgi:hypothetical protein